MLFEPGDLLYECNVKGSASHEEDENYQGATVLILSVEEPEQKDGFATGVYHLYNFKLNKRDSWNSSYTEFRCILLSRP